MSYTPTNWVNNTTKLNATNMNHIETGIDNNDTAIGDISSLQTAATDLVGAINEIIDDIEDANTFSSNEVETDETWIDGSKIYKKTITMNIGTSTSYNQAHNIDNADLSKMWIDQGNSFWVTPSVSETIGHYNSADDYSRFYLTAANVFCSFSSVYSTISKTAYVTIKYVKSS